MFTNRRSSPDREPLDPIPFPRTRLLKGRCADTDRLLEEFGEMSRRIEDLARALNCPSHFDDDDYRPRAA